MLGKTRHKTESFDAHIGEGAGDAGAGPARGVLQRPAPPGKFQHFRISPPADIALWVAHCWMVSWEIEGDATHIAETLPHPNFHLVCEEGEWTVSGVHTGKFSRTLKGRSSAFGIKFTPGGIRGFLKEPASLFGDKTVPAAEIFGTCISKLMLPPTSAEEMTASACAFLLTLRPKADPAIAEAGRIVESILKDPALKTVDDVCAFTALGKRTLQRLFQEYVGVGPKWVIRRYRLHELMERCHSGEKLDFAQEAVDLGYFDQAHLVNDFRSLIGYSPTQYQQMASGIKPGSEPPV
jgi:AraC-like DNA-binding protein